MLLKEEHFAVFRAIWFDKAANLRGIAGSLGLALDSIAFADDSPAERARVRQALPTVSVIELGNDPALYPARIADSGVFDHLPLNFRRSSARRQLSDPCIVCCTCDNDRQLR